jgi:hypothetical protein
MRSSVPSTLTLVVAIEDTTDSTAGSEPRPIPRTPLFSPTTFVSIYHIFGTHIESCLVDIRGTKGNAVP